MVHLNLHGHSNKHAADIEMIGVKIEEIQDRPYKIKKSIALKNDMINHKSIEIQTKLKELIRLRK